MGTSGCPVSSWLMINGSVMARPDPSLVRTPVWIFTFSLDAAAGLVVGRSRVVGEPFVAAATRIRVEQIVLRVVRPTAQRLVGYDGTLGADIERDAVVGVARYAAGEDVVARRRADAGAYAVDRSDIGASDVDSGVAVGRRRRVGDVTRERMLHPDSVIQVAGGSRVRKFDI